MAQKHQPPQEIKVPLKDSHPLKLQKSSAVRKYTTSKFSSAPPPPKKNPGG